MNDLRKQYEDEKEGNEVCDCDSYFSVEYVEWLENKCIQKHKALSSLIKKFNIPEYIKM